jgi:histidine triad (HIT) family protein
MQDSIFTKILKREIPARILYEDEYVFVIPDIMPTMRGQLLVISKKQAPYVFDLEDAEYDALMRATKKIAKACDAAFNTVRTCVVVEGFEVPHVHVRLYPCTENTLTWEPRYKATDEELDEVSAKVTAALG